MSPLRVSQYLLAALGALILIVLIHTFWPSTPAAGEHIVAAEQVNPAATVQTIDTGTGTQYQQLTYTWNGDRYTTRFSSRLRPALDYLTEHTTADSTIAAWWTHGHNIRGYTRRPVMVTAPTFWAWDNVIGGGNQTQWDAARRGPFADQRTFRDLARLLTTGNASRVAALLHQYNMSHLVLTKTDLRHYTEMAQIATHDAENVTTVHVLHCRTAGTDCRVQSRGGQSVLTYPLDAARSIRVPVRKTSTGYRIDGAARLIVGDRALIIPFHCMPDGKKRVAVSETELRGCIRFHPDHGHTRLVHVPGDAIDSTIIRLYLGSSRTIDHFEKQYDDSHTQVWAVTPR